MNILPLPSLSIASQSRPASNELQLAPTSEWKGRVVTSVVQGDAERASSSALTTGEETFLPPKIQEITPLAKASSIDLSKQLVVSPDHDSFMNEVHLPGIGEKFLVSRRFSRSEDYWCMIIQYGVSVGISLIPLADNSYPLIVGRWRVSCMDVVSSGSLWKRRFTIDSLLSEESRSFEHFTLDWPDLEIPDFESFNELLFDYLDLVEAMENPLVHLHCYGGHGRSGTFLLARALMSQPEQSHVEGLLCDLRMQRSRLVETEKQFKFAISQAELFVCRKFTHGKFSTSNPYSGHSSASHSHAPHNASS